MCKCCKQIPGQDGVARQAKLDKLNKGHFEAWLDQWQKTGKIPKWFPKRANIRMRRNRDVPRFLKRFDAIQKRTAKNNLQLH